ncbi:hypothetical protein GmHk_04G011011 [Glycine max]|nr:hypothetical protein GmHk_04G011011 [Glycine max]
MVEVSTEAIASLAQYYDQPLRCFTFGDFQLSPMVEEFEEILGCPLGGRRPYLFSGFYPSSARISKIVQISTQELDHGKQVKNGVVGIPRKCLEAKARILAGRGEWAPFIDILALLIFGGVLLPNVDGLVDLAANNAFLAYHEHKESPVVAMLADLYDTFDRRCEKSSTRIVCCTPALYVWLVLHLFRQEVRHAYSLESHRSCTEKGEANWDRLLANKEGASVNWFPRWKEGRTRVLISCRGFPNVPLMGTRGCVHKAWEVVQKKDKELRGSNNGSIGGYRRWLKAHVQGLDWFPSLRTAKREEVEAPEEDEEVQALRAELEQAQTVKERFKSAALKIRKENAELKDINIATTKALEQETKRTRREEHGQNKFLGALWGSNNELKLRREERDQSRVHSMVLKEELAACSRSKKSLAQHLEATEQSMLAIIGQYKEELNQSLTHEQKLVEDFAQAYAEKEARGRVIDALHQEATMWMDRFALTLNGSQDLPRLLAKARAMAEVFSAPEEIHRLINYYLVFAGERIEFGMRKGKFEYASNAGLNSNRRAPVVGTRKKEGDTHAVTTAPTWMKTPQNAQNSYQHNHPNFSIRAGSSLPTQVEGSATIEKAPAQHTAPATPRPTNNTTPGTSYDNPRRSPRDQFSPIPMAYSELWPSLLENHLVVAIPGKVFQSPYPKWYNSNATCAYHSGAPGHNIDSCLPFKYKVQHLINVGWLSFQEEGPNIKTNPLASHGGASVNAIEKDRPSGSKRLEDVATSRRFIYQSLQAACMVSHGGDKSDECLFHLGELHDMETCPVVEELLQRLMDWGQLEVSERGREEL